MPYPIKSYFNPDDRYRETWSLVPQVRTVSVSGQKTKSLYSSLSPSIPLFYILGLLAISFDIYLGFSILAKSGVNVGMIVGSVLFDLLLAIAPFLCESFVLKDWNHVVVENRIFQKRLECQTMRKGETDAQFGDRKTKIIEEDLKKYLSYQRNGKILRVVLSMIIFAIAGWKIGTYYAVLPPGISIFSVVNGKIVIIFSLLCAIFHIIGSEKAFAHLMFWFRKGPAYREHLQTHNNQRSEQPTPREIAYVGNYVNTTSGNSSIVVRDGKVILEFIHIIRDDEVQGLINAQTDDNAKRGVAIACKENQFVN